MNEQAMLCSSRRTYLASEVRWIARDDGEGAGYDSASFDPDGRSRLIEVKTMNGWERTFVGMYGLASHPLIEARWGGKDDGDAQVRT